ncbi:MAG: 50S ribosomal protein L25 [Planctomycetota bacterium]
MDYVKIEVKTRDKRGSRAMRRMRQDGRVPGVLYGLGRPNLELDVGEKELRRFLASGSHLVELKMGDKARHAILRELQLDPLTDQIQHFDFGRVADDVEIEDTCAIVTKGRPKGSSEGGLFQALLESIDVKALPRHLPGSITLDVTELGLGDAVYVRDLKLASEVSVLTPGDELVCHVTLPKVEAAAPAEAAEGAEGAEAAAAASPPSK